MYMLSQRLLECDHKRKLTVFPKGPVKTMNWNNLLWLDWRIWAIPYYLYLYISNKDPIIQTLVICVMKTLKWPFIPLSKMSSPSGFRAQKSMINSSYPLLTYKTAFQIELPFAGVHIACKVYK